jgi:hypothetical protein
VVYNLISFSRYSRPLLLLRWFPAFGGNCSAPRRIPAKSLFARTHRHSLIGQINSPYFDPS